MPVIYNSKKIIPAPLFSCQKQFQLADDGSVMGKTYQIQVKGRFVAYMGSPNSQGEFWDQSGYPPDEEFDASQLLKSQLAKLQALRKLFSDQGKIFEVMTDDGHSMFRCNPRILSVDQPEGPLTALCDYIITMEASQIFVDGQEDVDDSGTDFISKASEEWNIEVADEKLLTFRLTHSVNAVGKFVYAEDGTQAKKPWEYAKDYVLNKRGLGLDSAKMIAPGVLNADTLQAYNYLRGQQVNELTGSFGVNETWLCYAGGSAFEEFNVNTRISLEGRATVGVTGTITGLATYNNATNEMLTTRYAEASAKWTAVKDVLFSRAQTQSGITLNPTPLSREFGTNEVTGTVTYNYEFDDRPPPLLAGAKSTSVAQTQDNVADVFASIPVVGRALGPVLQPMGTVTSKKRTVTLTAQMQLATYSNPVVLAPASTNAILAYRPTGSQVFVERDEEGWQSSLGQYTRTVTWTYQ